MKKSIVWTAAAVAVVGFGIPAFAAVSSDSPQPNTTTPPSVTVSVVSSPVSVPSVSVEDIRGNCDEAEHANDPGCAGTTSDGTNTSNSVDDNQNRRGGRDHGGGSDG